LIDYVKGIVSYIYSEYIVVENRDIGYQIRCANPYSFQEYMNEPVQVFTYQYVREDILALFGFKTRDERQLFVKLLNVSGIGPKGALAILASGQPEQVIKAIEREDDQFLTKFPGVGKKTARQMILDLKGKLNDFMPEGIEMVQPADKVPSAHQDSNELDDAIEALGALGYSTREINKVLPMLRQETLTTDQYIKKALQEMFRK
jgi:Holliday junction DNA helicase RuvA